MDSIGFWSTFQPKKLGWRSPYIGSTTVFDCNLKAAVQAAAIVDEAVVISYVGQADAVMRAASAT
jgi:hypothetical protein